METLDKWMQGNPGRMRRAFCLILALSAPAGAQVYINDQWPITGPNGPTLSPPHVEQTNQCANSVYVDSIVPKAEITVFLGGTKLIGGPYKSKYGFADVPLTQALKTNDSITAKQTVDKVTSTASAPMSVGKMPAKLPKPEIDPTMYACAQIVAVHNLVSGTTVQVFDETVSKTAPIGSGATPNLWGNDWNPVTTPLLLKGHMISAIQNSCTGGKSQPSKPLPVLGDPTPENYPAPQTAIIGDDVITLGGLYTGAVVQVYDVKSPVAGGLATTGTNWFTLPAIIKATDKFASQQTLCGNPGPESPEEPPTATLPPPVLAGPICPHNPSVTVRDTTINSTLVLLKNGVVVGYGGAAPGDVPLDIAPPAVFADNDKVQVVEYNMKEVASSNTVTVGCTNVTTYHNDNQRTGWNPKEDTLTPANVTPTTFGLLPLPKNPVPLDGQVDGQPLVVANQKIEGMGFHDVVYVATEKNTVYAIDASSGEILKFNNLGTAVGMPLGCFNNAPTVGINSTPTIDVASQTMYVIAYVMLKGNPAYQLHALDLTNLKDKPGSPQIVSASATLEDGKAFPFNATYQRQRPALLDAAQNIYAAFGSFCDYKAGLSRGWLLGWNKSSLSLLSKSELTDQLDTLPPPLDKVKCTWHNNYPCYLSAIWMSGFGVAADKADSLYFLTGNSASGSYNPTFNLAESAVKMSSDLSAVQDKFTPSDVAAMDTHDKDFGSGGLLVLPDQPGPVPHLAVAPDKDGRLFILNRDNMGGFHTPDIPVNVPIGSCHCGPSYFQGSDGIGRVVSSGGTQLQTWKVNTAITPALASEATAALVDWTAMFDGGFFTSISSNATKPETAILWAIGRPPGKDHVLTLYAFDGTASGSSLTELWHDASGSWPSVNGNPNLVPTVANGKVYVATNEALAIFGITSSTSASRMAARKEKLMSEPVPFPWPPGALYWGTVKSVDGNRVTLTLRDGRLLQVDFTGAANSGSAIDPLVGLHVVVTGALNADGVLQARTMQRAKGPGSWGPDKPK
jgi:hypothetical protein